MEQNNQPDTTKQEIHISLKTIVNLFLSLLLGILIFICLFFIGFESRIVDPYDIHSRDAIFYSGILSKYETGGYYFTEFDKNEVIFDLFISVLKEKYYVILFLSAIIFGILKFKDKFSIKVN